MCTSDIMDDWFGIEKPKPVQPVATKSIAPPPVETPTKSSDEVQRSTEEERRKRAASTQSLAAKTSLTGGLGDADFSSLRRVTLG